VPLPVRDMAHARLSSTAQFRFLTDDYSDPRVNLQAASFDKSAQRLTAAFRGDLQRYRRGVVWPMTGVDFNADHQRQPRKLIESREYLEVWPVDVDADEVESFMTARACGDFCHSIGCDLRQ